MRDKWNPGEQFEMRGGGALELMGQSAGEGSMKDVLHTRQQTDPEVWFYTSDKGQPSQHGLLHRL
jgi:hypothetical protein